MESFVIDLNPFILACKEIHYINFFNTLFAASITLFFQSAVQNRGVCYTQECIILCMGKYSNCVIRSLLNYLIFLVINAKFCSVKISTFTPTGLDQLSYVQTHPNVTSKK